MAPAVMAKVDTTHTTVRNRNVIFIWTRAVLWGAEVSHLKVCPPIAPKRSVRWLHCVLFVACH